MARLDRIPGIDLCLRALARIRRTLLWRHLDRLTTPEQLAALVQKRRPELYLQYARASGQKQKEVKEVLAECGLDLRGSRVLDIGPGYGDALVVCRDLGASTLHYVEREPWFFTRNRLSGFAGFALDLQCELDRIPASSTYDLIWSKAAVVADHLITATHTQPLPVWLNALLRLTAPGGTVILCPDWHRDSHGNPCLAPAHNPFSDALLARGFTTLEVPIHVQAGYPLTFIRTAIIP